MPALKLIEAVKNGDAENIESLLNSGEDIEQKDDYGWTALNWAAGKGYTSIIEKLLAASANIANVGRDNRTAYQIALAAAHVESASVLQQAEKKACINLNKVLRPYCKAYVIAELRRFPNWYESTSGLADGTIVFVHQDFTVTRSLLHGKEVVFDSASIDWKQYCENQLVFAVPTDIDSAATFAANRLTEANQSPL